jgi:hypothetical protein
MFPLGGQPFDSQAVLIQGLLHMPGLEVER